MDYVVIDLEWNQPSTADQIIKALVFFSGEIIQIGAVKLNEDFEITDTFNIFVKPVYYTHIHEFVSKLTHITADDLEHGVLFDEALNKFTEWCPEKFLFLTWSNGDIKILRQNLAMHNLDSAWIPDFIDVQALFCTAILKASRCYSLTEAAAHIGEPEFAAHNALNDATVTAKICKHLKLHNIDINAKKRPLKNRNLYTPDLNSIQYPTGKSARNARENCEFCCPDCGGILRCNWITSHSDKNYCLIKCRCDKEYFVKLIIKSNSNGTKRANRTISIATEEDRNFYKKKLEEEKIKAKKRYNYWLYNFNHSRSRKKYM